MQSATEAALKRATEAIAARRPRIAVVGSVNLDFIVGVIQVPERGETITGDSLRVLPGGKGANQATQAALLGADVSLVGRVGSTVLAQMALETLQTTGVNIAHVGRDPDQETGLAFVFVEQTGDNRIVVAPRANAALTAEHVRFASETIAAADVLLLQLEIPDEAIAEAVRIASEAGCQVVLNPAPARPLSAEILSRVNYLIPNETEAASISGVPVSDQESAVLAARKLVGGAGSGTSGVGSEGAGGASAGGGIAHAIITLGQHGALAISANEPEPIHTAAVSVPQVVDPTGAGDAFCAALAVGIASGLDLADCMALGAMAGGHAVTSMGAQASMGTLADFAARQS